MTKSAPLDDFLKANSKVDAHAEYKTSATKNVCHNLQPLHHHFLTKGMKG